MLLMVFSGSALMFVVGILVGQVQAIEPLIPELLRSVGVAGALLAFLFTTGHVESGRTSAKWEARYDALREREELKDKKLIEDILPVFIRGVEVMGQVAKKQQNRDE